MDRVPSPKSQVTLNGPDPPAVVEVKFTGESASVGLGEALTSTVGRELTVSEVDALTLFPALSLANAWMVKLPGAEGVHINTSESALTHPGGKPE
jgi:hypothetical protein